MIGQQGNINDAGIGITLGYRRWCAVAYVLDGAGSILDVAPESLRTRAEAATPSEDAVRAFGGDILSYESVAGANLPIAPTPTNCEASFAL